MSSQTLGSSETGGHSRAEKEEDKVRPTQPQKEMVLSPKTLATFVKNPLSSPPSETSTEVGNVFGRVSLSDKGQPTWASFLERSLI